MKAHRPHVEDLPFQIAPMIDVIFILILFFMCSAGSVKVETELSIRLPGTVTQDQPLKMVDEQMVQVQADGQIVLNEQPYGTPTDKELGSLSMTLSRFRELSEANKTDALLTIMADPKSKYERVIDVLNVCAGAKISGVTFTTSEEE